MIDSNGKIKSGPQNDCYAKGHSRIFGEKTLNIMAEDDPARRQGPCSEKVATLMGKSFPRSVDMRGT